MCPSISATRLSHAPSDLRNILHVPIDHRNTFPTLQATSVIYSTCPSTSATSFPYTPSDLRNILHVPIDLSNKLPPRTQATSAIYSTWPSDLLNKLPPTLQATSEIYSKCPSSLATSFPAHPSCLRNILHPPQQQVPSTRLQYQISPYVTPRSQTILQLNKAAAPSTFLRKEAVFAA
jgi:hypothetical protein